MINKSLFGSFDNAFHVCTFDYASISYVRRHWLWSLLANFGVSILDPWCIVGDFNFVMGVYEKCGRPLLCVADDDIREAIDFSKVLPIDTVGSLYMWAHCGVQDFVASKLHRAFYS